MRHLLKGVIIAAALVLTGEAATAQGVDIRIGPGGARIRERPAVVEERIIRRPARASRTVCRTEIRERVTRGGIVIRRPVEVCRRVVHGY